MIPGMIAVPASAASVSAEVSGRKAYRAASTVPTLTSPQRAVSTCEKGGNALNKSVRSLFASLAIGAILVGSSAVAMAVPVLAQDSSAEDVTLTVMASQDWIKPAEHGARQEVRGRDRHQASTTRSSLPTSTSTSSRPSSTRARRPTSSAARPASPTSSSSTTSRTTRSTSPTRSGRAASTPPRSTCPASTARSTAPRSGTSSPPTTSSWSTTRTSSSELGISVPDELRRVQGRLHDDQGRRHHARSTSPIVGRLAPRPLVPHGGPAPSRRQSPASRTSSTPTRRPSPATRT